MKRVSYQCALIIKSKGIEAKSLEYYTEKWEIPFDLPLFLEYLSQEKEVDSGKVFFERLMKEEAEYRKRDLVIDPRESWKEWIKRTANFEEPPMIDRHELPDDDQPHKKLFSAIDNYLNGINPYPPGHKWNKIKKNKVAASKDASKDSSWSNLVDPHNPESNAKDNKENNENAPPAEEEKFSEHFYIESDSEDISDSDWNDNDKLSIDEEESETGKEELVLQLIEQNNNVGITSN